jgi:CRISPR-associated protein Csd1
MMLQELRRLGQQLQAEDARDQGEVPSAYKKQPIRWIVQLAPGEPSALVETSTDASGRDRGIRIAAPYLRRSGQDIKPQLLADKAEFVFGISEQSKKGGMDQPEKAPKRARDRRLDFLALVQACAETTGLESVRLVRDFLERGAFANLLEGKSVSASDLVTFRVGQSRPIDLAQVQAFWQRTAPRLSERGVGKLDKERLMAWHKDEVEAPADAPQWECIVCGTNCAPLRVHPVAIHLPRSVADQQCSIITANKEAFFSYGLEQSLIAPTCRQCGEQYARTVNRLIAEEKSHLTVGSAVYVFWARGDAWSPVSELANPEPGEVRKLLASAFGGDRAAVLHTDAAKFYAAAFSASGGRVVVRDWLETTVPLAQHRLARFFKLQQLVGRSGGEGKPYGVYSLAAATVREANKEIRPETVRALVRCALHGGPLPTRLLAQAVLRNRAEQTATRNRVALIKMVLLSQRTDFNPEDSSMERLDPANRDPAYLCGRLLSVLERIQQAALGKTNTTIVGRFYGTASSAPASVFGRLMRGGQTHLEKLRKEKPGAYKALKHRLEEIAHPDLKRFPKLLTLEQQGLFSLGYFHQCARDREAALAAKKKREAAAK